MILIVKDDASRTLALAGYSEANVANINQKNHKELHQDEDYVIKMIIRNSAVGTLRLLYGICW